MLATTSLKRLAAATLAGGALAVSPLLLPAASAAPACGGYAAPVSTTTTVSASPSNPVAGRPFTAIAKVTNDGTGAPVSGGTVEFKYKNQRASVAVVGGSASTTFTAGPGRGQLIANYSGFCAGGAANVKSSSDGLVLGVEASAGGNGNGNGNNRSATGLAGVSSGSSTGGLAATGTDTQTELLGGLGLGLVAVGGLSLMVHRRRVQA